MSHQGAKMETCTGCGALIRWFAIIHDHDPGCQVIAPDPQTDAEKAAALAVYFDSRSDHWPEATLAARLLRKIR